MDKATQKNALTYFPSKETVKIMNASGVTGTSYEQYLRLDISQCASAGP